MGPSLWTMKSPRMMAGHELSTSAGYWSLRWASQVAQWVQNPSAMQETCSGRRRVRGEPWRRAWQPTPVFFLGESHGQRSLVGYSPWGRKESNTTEVTEHACVVYNEWGRVTIVLHFKILTLDFTFESLFGIDTLFSCERIYFLWSFLLSSPSSSQAFI